MPLNMKSEKLDYMHYKPLQPHWQLCKDPASINFHQRSFMKQEKINSIYLLI